MISCLWKVLVASSALLLLVPVSGAEAQQVRVTVRAESGGTPVAF
jgi:hypothetical protein